MRVGQLSHCLKNQKALGESMASCIKYFDSSVLQGKVQEGVEVCLFKVRYKSLLKPPRSEQEIIFDYYSCMLEGELSQLNGHKECYQFYQFGFLQKLLSVFLGVEGLIRILILTFALAAAIHKMTFRSSDSFLDFHSGDTLRKLRVASQKICRLGREQANELVDFFSEISRFIRRKSEVQQRYSPVTPKDDRVLANHEVPEDRKKASKLGASLSSNEAEQMPCEEYNCHNFVDEYKPVNLQSKGTDLVFDLTTKEGRKEWKAYINRGKKRQQSSNESTVSSCNGIIYKGLSGCTKTERAIELNPVLQNVPLYDRHGKPLRRVYIPGTGWISRRKYLEQHE
ncbi:LADA_0G05182g1_1 [Lachancea dasiensis]|uniref:LADA_0G05182g1_1 n=1 Tax=Lachancea dasiensis TaxID=1072105 RepID=A0A1G4JSL2_9SACH|nr:LADA_0G05182g1_1 [Lachancea dasiensis]